MSLSSKTEVAANGATIVLALVLSVALVRHFVIPKAPSVQPILPGVKVGTNMKPVVPGVDWAKNKQTLLMGLSTQCHFCSESAPFLQWVAQQARAVELIALLPQSVAEGKDYLKRLGVPVDDVRQVSLGSVGITGTPTLVLVNGDGTVSDVWMGKLSTEQETHVMDILTR